MVWLWFVRIKRGVLSLWTEKSQRLDRRPGGESLFMTLELLGSLDNWEHGISRRNSNYSQRQHRETLSDAVRQVVAP